MNDPLADRAEPIGEPENTAKAHKVGARRKLWLWGALAVPALGWATLALGGAQMFHESIEQHASAALGRAVAIDGGIRIIVTPFSVHVAADDVTISNAQWADAAPLVQAGTLSARFDSFDLLIGRYTPRGLGVQAGTISFERRLSDGAANWHLGAAGQLFDPALVQKLAADDILLRYHDPRIAAQGWLTLKGQGAGTLQLAGSIHVGERAFDLAGKAMSAESRPFTVAMDARGADMALRLEAQADGPFALARSDLTGQAKGRDLASLASLAGIALPSTADFSLQADLRHGRGGWHFSRISGHVGQTDIAGKLTLDQRGERPRIVAKLASKSLHLADGFTMIGLHDGDAPSVSQPWRAEPVATRLLPDATLSPTALRQFDAVIDYSAQAVEGGALAASHLTMRLALVDGRIMISPSSLDLGGGFLSSDVFIDARRSPAFARYDIRLSPTPMGRVLAGWGVAPQETTALARGRIQLSGTGTTLRETIGNADGRIALLLPAGRVRMQRASSSALDMEHLRTAMFGADDAALEGLTSLNCGLLAFSVKDGLATADPLMIDTDGHVVTGRGEIDLRSERIDMRLEADGKNRAWFARPAPLIIGGTFADPVVLREPIEMFTPRRLFGFSMLMPDLGAIFGFVDPSRTEAPACGPLLRGGGMADQAEASPSASRG